MTVTFIKTIHFAPFGDNQVEKFSEGSTYTARGAHEARMFDYYIEQGFAKQAGVERPVDVETKIATPKSKK